MQFGYIGGYKDAADQLIENNFKYPNVDILMFPILFLYRQYLELVMKNIIIRHYEKNAEIAQAIIKNTKHNLLSVWEQVKLILHEDLTQEQKETIENILISFHKYDSGSTNFRYYFDMKLESTLPEKFSVNLIELQNAMERIDDILYFTYGV